MALTYAPAEVRKQRDKLERRMRDAYKRMEYWERRHGQVSELLSVLYMRFPELLKRNKQG